MCSSTPAVSTLLTMLADGDETAAEELFPLVYNELHRLADHYMQNERRDHTLQPTALIHEAYLQLVRPDSVEEPQFENIQHFMATAAVVMRRILINHAKAKQTLKRGGGQTRLQIDEITDAFESRSIDLIALDEAMERLKGLDERQFRLVELRFFGGMTFEQCASYLGMSERTAHYEWSHAKAWLRRQLESS